MINVVKEVTIVVLFFLLGVMVINRQAHKHDYQHGYADGLWHGIAEAAKVNCAPAVMPSTHYNAPSYTAICTPSAGGYTCTPEQR